MKKKFFAIYALIGAMAVSPIFTSCVDSEETPSVEALRNAKAEELKAMLIDCDAICILGERYRKLALEKAATEEDPQRKKELEQIAENCSVVPAHKPQTKPHCLRPDSEDQLHLS